MEHLLKLECSSANEPRRLSADRARRTREEIEDLLGDAPSLRRDLPAMLDAAQEKAAPLAAALLKHHGGSAAGIQARMRSGGFAEKDVFGAGMPGGPA